ncbi:DEAD-box ATP-dependent RNA helicase 36-like protein [Drosera capensis]
MTFGTNLPKIKPLRLLELHLPRFVPPLDKLGPSLMDRKLAEEPYGVFALVVTPTRELAYQLAEQFRALGFTLHVRCTVLVGGMDKITQAKTLIQRPHVVIVTPGRIKVLLEENIDLPQIFCRTKFLVLDEADKVLDEGFEDELRAIFQCLPKNRQTLLFSATMTSDLKTLLELSDKKAYFYELCEGFKTVESLMQQYLFFPQNVKDVYLLHVLSKMEDMKIRSCIIFVSECRYLVIVSECSSSSIKPLSTIDMCLVMLVVGILETVHRVGRTARAGRGGLALSFVTQKDIKLFKQIEALLGKCKENDILAEITKVYKAKRVAKMKMVDDGFQELVKNRKKQKLKMLAGKGLSQKNKKRELNRRTDD